MTGLMVQRLKLRVMPPTEAQGAVYADFLSKSFSHHHFLLRASKVTISYFLPTIAKLLNNLFLLCNQQGRNPRGMKDNL